jgi:hypothetical protein
MPVSNAIRPLRNGKIYKGHSTNYSECIMTVKDNNVHCGSSTITCECLATVDGIVNYGLIAVLLGP